MIITAFDLETTGLTPKDNDIIEVGIVHFEDGRVAKNGDLGWIVKTKKELDFKVQKLTGLTQGMVDAGEHWPSIAPRVLEEIDKSDYWCIQNSDFDVPFLSEALSRVGFDIPQKPVLDTLRIAQRFIPYSVLPHKNLGKLSKFYGVPLEKAHRAVEDATATGHILFAMLNQFGLKPEDLAESKPLFLGDYHIGEDPFVALYSGLPRKFEEKT